MCFSWPCEKTLHASCPLYFLCIAALFRGLIFYRPKKVVYMAAHICSDEASRGGGGCLLSYILCDRSHLTTWIKHPFLSSQWYLWEGGCILFHSMHLHVVWMLSIPPQTTLSWWESFESSHLKWENNSDVLPFFSLFSSVAQPPTVFSTQKCEEQSTAEISPRVGYVLSKFVHMHLVINCITLPKEGVYHN